MRQDESKTYLAGVRTRFLKQRFFLKEYLNKNLMGWIRDLTTIISEFMAPLDASYFTTTPCKFEYTIGGVATRFVLGIPTPHVPPSAIDIYPDSIFFRSWMSNGPVRGYHTRQIFQSRIHYEQPDLDTDEKLSIHCLDVAEAEKSVIRFSLDVFIHSIEHEYGTSYDGKILILIDVNDKYPILNLLQTIFDLWIQLPQVPKAARLRKGRLREQLAEFVQRSLFPVQFQREDHVLKFITGGQNVRIVVRLFSFVLIHSNSKPLPKSLTDEYQIQPVFHIHAVES